MADVSARQLQHEQALLLESLVDSLRTETGATDDHTTHTDTAPLDPNDARGRPLMGRVTRSSRLLVPVEAHPSTLGGGSTMASSLAATAGGIPTLAANGVAPAPGSSAQAQPIRLSLPQHTVPSLANGLLLTPDPHRIRRPRSTHNEGRALSHSLSHAHAHAHSAQSHKQSQSLLVPTDGPRKRGRKPKILLQQLSAAAAAAHDTSLDGSDGGRGFGMDTYPQSTVVRPGRGSRGVVHTPAIPPNASEKAYLYQTYYTIDAKMYPDTALHVLDMAANKPNPDFGPASDHMPRRKRGSLKAEMLARAPETFYPSEPWESHPLASQPHHERDRERERDRDRDGQNPGVMGDGMMIAQGETLSMSASQALETSQGSLDASVVVTQEASFEMEHMPPPMNKAPLIPHVNVDTVVGPLPEPARTQLDHTAAMDQAPYIPKALLRLHSYHNDPEDVHTHVWASTFYKSHLQGSEEYTDVLVTAGGCYLCFYDCDTGRLLKRFQCLKKDDLYAFDWTFLPDLKEDVFVAGGRHGILHIILPKQNACIESLKTSMKEINSMKFLKKDSNILLIGSGDGSLQAWKIRAGLDGTAQSECLVSFVGHKKSISSLAISPTGRLCVSGDRTGAIRVWDIDEAITPTDTELPTSNPVNVPTKKRSRALFTFHYSAVDDLQFISDSVIVSKGSTDSCILLWKLQSPTAQRSDPSYRVFKKVLHRPAEEYHHKFCVCTATQQFVTSNSHGEVTIFNMNSESIDQYPYAVLAFKGQASTIRSVCMSDDGKYIASTTDQNLVAIWMKRS